MRIFTGRRGLVALLLFAVAGAGSINAQSSHTTDIARLTFGLSVGRHSGDLLWTVPAQTISAGIDPSTIKPGIDPVGKPYPTSDFALHREIGSGVTVSGNVTAYMNQHIGFTGEITYLGLKYEGPC